MESKRKNIYIAIFVMTTIIASCVAVYFAIELNNKAQENNVQEGKVEEIATDEVDKTQTNVEIKEVEKIVEKVVEKAVIPEMDPNKCLNKTSDDGTYRFLVGDSVSGLSCNRNDDKKSVTLELNVDKIKAYYNVDRKVQGNYETVTIDNFSGEIVDICLSSIGGQAVGYEVFLFLMKDGSVEYLPVCNALKNNNLKSYGKISDVIDVARIGSGQVKFNEGPGYGFPIAIKADGSFYDLSKILRPTGYFNF